MSEPIQAIATNNFILHNIDAKKLYVQEPLFTANSGDAVYVGWRPDETVLWEGTCKANSSVNLSESYKNFEKIKIYGYHPVGAAMTKEVRMSDITATTYKEITLESWVSWGNASNYKFAISMPCDFTSDTVLATRAGRFVGNWDNSWQAATGNDPNNTTLTQVVGINRISGGNA
jgi:hypothetical protein